MKNPTEMARHELLKAAQVILAAYKWKGWTKKKLASKANVSRQTLTELLAGNPRVSFYTLAKVCRVLGLDFDLQVKETKSKRGG